MDDVQPVLSPPLPLAGAVAAAVPEAVSEGDGPGAAGEFALDDVPRLTAALRQGDEDAFAWLHGVWGARIGRYCFALAAGDDGLAAEIAQATWLRLVRHIRVLEDEAALWAWTACAARHAATDLRRKGGRYRRALARFAEWWPGVSSSRGAGMAEEPDDTALLHALEQAVAQLSQDEQALLEARYFQGVPLAAIGARLSVSERAVEGRLARLRQRLRELIAHHLRQSQSDGFRFL